MITSLFTSIYADIKEFQFDLKYDNNQRKISTFSNITTSTSIPPRFSTGAISIEPVPMERLQYRRRSDFGCSNMGMIHPKQFSSIFSNRHINGTSSDRMSNETGSLSQMTQFKINSITHTKVKDISSKSIRG